MTPVLGAIDDPKLPPDSIDLAIMVDVYHELSQPQRMLQRLKESLQDRRPAGAVGIPRARIRRCPILPLHKMTKAQVKLELEAEGFKQSRVFDDLPWQHLLVYVKP